MGKDIPLLEKMKDWLSRKFSIKDLEEAAYILNIKIYRDRSRSLLGLSQSTYRNKVLKWFSMKEFKREFLPISHGVHLSKDMCLKAQIEREHINKVSYASTIGSIMYTMLCMRLDVSYGFSIMSRY